jgi:hypothetical protein
MTKDPSCKACYTTNVINFPVIRQLTPEEETIRQTRLKLQECWAIRAESRRIKRGYEERQRKIEELMDGLGI